MITMTLNKLPFSPKSVAKARGSRRLRLWEIPAHCHCPVVGVCLPLPAMRRLAEKNAPNLHGVNDYDLHAAVVQLARARNALSEAIHDELELRHAAVVRVFRQHRDVSALKQAWRDAIAAGEVAGALWAALTHPACNAQLGEQLGQEMHMLQHQAGAALRLDIHRFHQVLEENACLARNLASAQQRTERLLHEKCSEIEALNARLMQQRADIIGRETERASLVAEFEALRVAVPDAAARARLAHQLNYQEERSARLALENARLHKQLASQASGPEVVPAVAEHVAAAPDASLDGQRILCVGGRESAVKVYRKLVEQAGGQFQHHDGGIEDRFGQLDSALGAADLVVCQTGCISHNAYWRVKDHCKRTGKRCAFVETPSAAGLARGLRNLLADVLVDSADGNQNESTCTPASADVQKTRQESSYE